MKSKKIFLILLSFIIVFSIYWLDCIETMAGEMSNEKTDSVSTGAELVEWMESHKNTGGKVKLLDNVVLEGVYCYCPDRVNLPSVFIDTNNFTITVTGEVELLSDNHLIFQGEAENKKDIIRVAKGGFLSLSGVTIENSEPEKIYALWQEEGSGLAVEDNCHISGKIHYADTKFVVDHEFVCVVVDQNQTVEDVLPKEIKCSVNFQGKVYANEQMSVSWNLSGTEKEQEKRMRFLAEGFFSDAAFTTPPVCTVVYNDYSLTFMEVNGFVNKSVYYFKGSYIKAEECLPMAVTYEYSFDGEEWIADKISTTSNDMLLVDGFFIVLSIEQWDTTKYPYLYLRLTGNHNENIYFSNILRYSADNLKIAEDQGGNRGGGTSITKPPEEPQKDSDSAFTNSDTEQLSGAEQESSTSGNLNTEAVKTDAYLNTEAESGTINAETETVHSTIANAESISSGENKTLLRTIMENSSQKPTDIESVKTANSGQSTSDFAISSEYINNNTTSIVSNEKSSKQVSEAVYYSENMEVKEGIFQRKTAIVISGIVILSVFAGGAGYCFHIGIFHKFL